MNAILEDNLAPHLIDVQASPNPVVQEVKIPDEPVDISKKSRTKYNEHSFTLRIQFFNAHFMRNRTVYFNEMREVLDDKQKDLKSVILDRVNEQVAAEVYFRLFSIDG